MRFIGLMGVKNDRRTLVSPKGKRLIVVPRWVAWRVQRLQHYVAQKTWR